ncbi:MAG: AmmeMemoRadiSam system protein B [Thermodesulfovibrionales bacterium]|nr:AmmeMemoRadiSam system protein B [Thermodesulfovibrionales bacterium]
MAGSFYPLEAARLRLDVKAMLARAEPSPHSGRLVTLISPHAGYIYSGQVAAAGYRQLEGRRYSTVVLIGSSHRESFRGAAVLAEGSLATPLGNVRIDESAVRALIDEKAGVRIYPKAFEMEHSLEVQLPFLQVTLAHGFKVVPILLGQIDRDVFEHLAAGLSHLASRQDVLIIASTDLSHYHDYATAKEMDKKMIDAIRRLSVQESLRLTSAGEAEMCGSSAVLVSLEASRRVGANRAEVYASANSGDVTGDRGRVVGYVSAGLFVDPLDQEGRRELLRIARETVTSYVMDRKVPGRDIVDQRFEADGAVFVTINTHGRLRGCIGDVRAWRPLIDSVVDNAVKASSKDHRFPPMSPHELKDMALEISILSHLTPVGGIEEIEVGRHGLLLSKSGRSGLLLPQVPVQQGWDRDTFLRQLSMKAGLPPDAWRQGATIYRFTADVFHE